MNFKIARRLFVAVAASSVSIFAAHALAAPFTSGDLAVLQAAASANNTTASILEINPALTSQTAAVQTISINGTNTTATPLRISGSASSTGYLSHTDDRTLLTLTGAATFDTAANVNTYLPRAVGALDATGTYAQKTTYTGVTAMQTRSASSLNDTSWFIGDQNGQYTNGATTPDPNPGTANNVRSVKSFGGTVYTLANNTINIMSAASGGTITPLTGLSADSNAQDFYLVSSAGNSTYDELYVLDESSGPVGQINKFSLVSGSWVANSSLSTNSSNAGFGLAAAKDGSNVDLFFTSGTGATTANKVLELMDSAGFNSNITAVSATPTLLFTTATGTILKGIDFVPVPEPTCLSLVVILLPLASRRRRSN